MATHSYIGILHENGGVSAVYCHYNGFLKGNGIILYDHYKSLDKVKELISKGDFESLKKDTSQIDYYEDCDKPDSYFSVNHLQHKMRNEDYLYLFNEKENEWYVGNNKLKDSLEERNLLIHDVDSFKCITVLADNDYSILLDRLINKEHEDLLLFLIQNNSRFFKDEKGNDFVSILFQNNQHEIWFNNFLSYLQQDRGTDYCLVEYDGNSVQISGDMEFSDINTVLEDFRIDCPKFREITQEQPSLTM